MPGELNVVTMVQTENAVEFFRTAVLDLLLRLKKRLRRCRVEDCGRPFVFARSHQRFCSTRCQSTAGLARYVERQGGKERFAKKRSDAYYDRKEKVLGKLKRSRRAAR